MNTQPGPGGVVVSWDDAKPIAAGSNIWRRNCKDQDGLQKIASVGSTARQYAGQSDRQPNRCYRTGLELVALVAGLLHKKSRF